LRKKVRHGLAPPLRGEPTVINIDSVVESDLKQLVEQIEKTGQPILIVRGDKPSARIVPQKKKDPFEMNPMLEGACFVGDPTEPLPNSDWPEESR
jgi:antitoxin (DNA-binding transcriptional repressor) of toxin-antitoxin stability system